MSDSEFTISAVNSAQSIFNSEENPRSQKTPVSLLQELCAKCGIVPTYEIMSSEGQIHDPIFVYRVTASDIIATAKGNSKKRAKHAAALAVLNEIRLKSLGRNEKLASKIETLM
jgi:dsRNA-specific ribonuclease